MAKVPENLLEFPFDQEKIIFPQNEENIQVEPECALIFDATWENLFNGRSLCDTDRLQFLAGYGYKWFIGNIGYSCRNNPGLIANLRFKVTDYNWLQLKYDGGIECVQISCAMQFN